MLGAGFVDPSAAVFITVPYNMRSPWMDVSP
jgi:hypothetical protein